MAIHKLKFYNIGPWTGVVLQVFLRQILEPQDGVHLEDSNGRNQAYVMAHLEEPGTPYWRGRISTFGLLILTNLYKLILIMQRLFDFLQNMLP